MFLDTIQPSRKKRQTDEPVGNLTLPEEFAIEELGLDFTEEQRQICSNDLQCMFDLFFAGSEEIALATLDHSREVTEQARVLGKQNTHRALESVIVECNIVFFNFNSEYILTL